MPQNIQLNLNPPTLSEFIGNEQIKKILFITIDACKSAGLQPPHMLFLGQRGFGKTTLAALFAKELGMTSNIISAKAVATLADLNSLMVFKLPDILILDEIHGLKHDLSDLLHQCMDNFEYSYVDQNKRMHTIKTKPFSLIGITTEEGKLTAPFYSRFRKKIYLEQYTTINLQTIIMNAARANKIMIESTAAFEIASRSGGVPRTALLNFVNAYEYALKFNNGKINYQIAYDSLQLHDIDSRGLCKQQRLVLMCLDSHPVGIENIAQRIGVSSQALESFYEPLLIQLNFIERTPRGRVLTAAGKKYKDAMHA